MLNFIRWRSSKAFFLSKPNAHPMNIAPGNSVEMESFIAMERTILSNLNAQFISNFINQDTEAHDQIIYKDFICIHSDGTFVGRKEYMKEWSSGFNDAKYESFFYMDEVIRIFGDFALIRAKTVYTKRIGTELISGNSIYTDTYFKEKGRWWCIQAQITAVKK
jgi:hypothetical protein